MLKEINYSFERKDYVRFLYFDRFKKRHSWIFVLFIVLLSICSFIRNSYTDFSYTDLFSTIFFIICITYFLCYVLTPYIATLKHEKIDVSIKLDSDKKSFIMSDLTTVEFNWSHIKKIYNTKHNILIYILENRAIVIPKRTFKDEQDLNETWSLIQECYNKNKI